MSVCGICEAHTPGKFKVVKYTGTCQHLNPEHGYGFRSAWNCEGIGMYSECKDCKALTYFPDFESCSESEIEWFKNSPWNDGWVLRA